MKVGDKVQIKDIFFKHYKYNDFHKNIIYEIEDIYNEPINNGDEDEYNEIYLLKSENLETQYFSDFQIEKVEELNNENKT